MGRPTNKELELNGARRENLILAAAKLFNEKGYDRTTVREVADDVGITSGTIFYHFESKASLLEGVIQHGMTTGLDIVEKYLKKRVGSINRFHGLVHSHLVALSGTPGNSHRVSFQEWGSLPIESRTRLRSINEKYRNVWKQTLEDLKNDGHLNSDPEYCRLTTIAALNWSPVWLLKDTSIALADAADQFCSVALNMEPAQFSRLKQAECKIVDKDSD